MGRFEVFKTAISLGGNALKRLPSNGIFWKLGCENDCRVGAIPFDIHVSLADIQRRSVLFC